MKKVKRIALVVCTFLLVMLLTGCNKTAVTSDKFKSVVEAKGFTVTDSTGLYDSSDITEVVVGNSSDNTMIAAYFKYKSVDIAKEDYNKSFDDTDAKKGSGSITTQVNIGNYNKYTLKTNGNYYVLERVDDTLVFFQAPDSKKDEVDEMIKNLGY